jgi:hypothetical protein
LILLRMNIIEVDDGFFYVNRMLDYSNDYIKQMGSRG